MKKIVFYQLSQQAYNLISATVPCEVTVVDATYLDTTVEELFCLELMQFSDGPTFAIYKGFEQADIISFVNATQSIHPMIHASYTENNRLWNLNYLTKELEQEHRVFGCYEKIVLILNSLNPLMSSITDENKRVVMEAYMAYQGQMNDVEILEKLVVNLNKILEDMKDEVQL